KGTLEGCSPFTGQVLNHGHTMFCLHIATVNRFPSVSKKMQESWASLQEGVKGSTDLEEELTRIDQDTSLKERAVNYVWGAASQIQGELVTKAHQRISASYNIPGTMKPQDVTTAVEWLIKTGVFLDGDLDIKTRTYDKQQPFHHPIIKDLIVNQWYSSKGEGAKYVSIFKEMPNCLLALVATVLFSFCFFF
ncbi:hypothetical protein SCLCIDRAFT_131683, partial [Scleroderma citrinum Foug A]